MKIEQMALLNCLMYYDIELEKNYTLGELIEEVREDDERWNDILESKPGVMSREKTKNVIDAIMYDNELRNMEIIASTSDRETEQGPVMVCLVNEKNKEAVFAFRGTNGAEWIDNAEAFLKESSKLQNDALKFFNDTVEKYNLVEKGYSIDVTGHSKGGNKAQYITIMNPHVRECYSFEGQGFSIEFVKKYNDKIEERKNKIVTYAAEKDYVNPLGYDIAGKRVFYETNKPKENIFNFQYTMPVIDRLLSHSPGAYIHFENGKVRMNKETKQSKLSFELNKMTLQMMNEDKEDKYGYFMALMGVIQNMHSCEPIIDEYQMPTKKQIKYGLKDMFEYMKKNGASKALLYMLADPCFVNDENEHRNANIADVFRPLNFNSNIDKSKFLPYTIQVEEISNISNLKGIVSVCFADKLVIQNIGIIEGREQKLDVVLPQYKTSDGFESYYRILNNEFWGELKKNILDAYTSGYKRMLSNKNLFFETSIEKLNSKSAEVKIQINGIIEVQKVKFSQESDKSKIDMPCIRIRDESGIRLKQLFNINDSELSEQIKNDLERQYAKYTYSKEVSLISEHLINYMEEYVPEFGYAEGLYGAENREQCIYSMISDITTGEFNITNLVLHITDISMENDDAKKAGDKIKEEFENFEIKVSNISEEDKISAFKEMDKPQSLLEFTKFTEDDVIIYDESYSER